MTAERAVDHEQLSLTKIIALHLLPGLALSALAFILAYPGFGISLNIGVALNIAIAAVLIPFELAVIWYFARKGKVRFREVLGFKHKIPLLQLAFWVIVLVVIGLAVLYFVAPFEHALWGDAIPSWLKLEYAAESGDESLGALLLAVSSIALSVIAGPLTEELYFRGLLLPRMEKLGAWAPLISAALFSLYHLFSPWEFFTRILLLLPLVYVVWWKRDIRIGIWAHILMNLIYGTLVLGR
jgi:membrane protease YdiL (CAAX protease family)